MFESLVQTTTNNGGAGGFEKVTFSTGGVTLEFGTPYIGFIESQLPIINQSSFQVAAVGTDPYADGIFRAAPSQTNIAVTPWSGFEALDYAFEFKFSPSITPVPEPSTIILLGIGIGALLRWQFQRQK